MKRICLGTMITILYQSRKRSSDTIKAICAGIFAAFGLEIKHFNRELPSHLKSGHDSAPTALVDAARNLSIEDIDKGFEQKVLPLIHNDKHEAVLLAIKDILDEDKIILDNYNVGKSPGFEKNIILSTNTFDESALLANVVTYAILNTENNKMSASIKEIEKDYVDGFISSKGKVFIISPVVEQDNIVPLKRTLKDPMFDRIFKKAADINIIGLNNPSRAAVFYLVPNNCRFRYRDLKDFIINNIGNYVFSRAQIERIKNTTNSNYSAIGSRAMLKFVQKYGSNSETVLGELLLYIFMEQVMDAPKIMTKIEIDEFNSNTVSKSDGIHLLSVNQSGKVFYQIVFGASNIEDDLTIALDRAFDKIKEIEANSDDELLTVDNTTQRVIYEPEATEFIRKLMLPQRDGTYKPDMAFSAFLGYTVKLDEPETDSFKYRTAIKKQLEKDINSIRQHICDLVLKNGMGGYSFNFFVMPFNDASSEKISIIKDMLTGGVI